MLSCRFNRVAFALIVYIPLLASNVEASISSCRTLFDISNVNSASSATGTPALKLELIEKIQKIGLKLSDEDRVKIDLILKSLNADRLLNTFTYAIYADGSGMRGGTFAMKVTNVSIVADQIIVNFDEISESRITRFTSKLEDMKNITLLSIEHSRTLEYLSKVVKLPAPMRLREPTPSDADAEPDVKKMVFEGEINGYTIQDLEARMRPGQLATSGFIGVNESLVKLLLEDDKFVRTEAGLTHRQLAEPLFMALKAAQKRVSLLQTVEFEYGGQKFLVSVDSWMGYQSSPFFDGMQTSIDITILNPLTGKKIKFSGLMPEMIKRYGFYEGRGIPYRLDPRTIIEFFAFNDLVSK